MRRHPYLLALLLATMTLGARAANTSFPPAMPPAPPAALIPDHGAASTSFARDWPGAFITGNGTMGAMVMGANTAATPPRPQEDTLFFSHSRLFLPVGTREVVPKLGDALAQLRQLIRTRGYGPAFTATYAAAQQQGYPGLMYADPFLPAFEFKLKMPAAGTPRDYLRTEDFSTGEVAIRWADDAGSYIRKLFISRADNLAVLWIGPDATPANTAPAGKPPKISCELWIPPIPGIPVRTFQLNNPAAAPADGAANTLIQASADVDASGITLHSQYREGQGAGYDAAVRIIADGGTADTAEGHISVKDAAGILVFLRLEPFGEITSNSDRQLRQSLDEIAPRYDQLLAAHVKIHGELFNRVGLDLAAGADRKRTTDALLARANGKKLTLPPALLEKLYDGARYELLCATGTRPPNLQGLWAASWAPPASLAGDYGFNSSFHLALASTLSGNMPELLTSTFHFADDNLADWQLNAKNLFNARGILVPLHQSASGKMLLWSDRQPGGLCWTAGGALLAHWYYDYYLFTGDRQFLAQTAVPFMRQVATFYEDFLFVDATGKYRFSPSYSTDNAAGDNAALDIMAATELLTNLSAACRDLHIEPESVARWQVMLPRMPTLLIAPSGELQEWALPGVMNKANQRHIPHLYGVYPGRQLDPQTTPELWQAARAAYETRLNQWFRPLTSANDTNPQPIQDRLQMGLCAARFGDGVQVGEILTRIAARNTYPSMMTQRYEDGKTFVADAAGALPEMLNAALLDSRPGRIDLLPALPPGLPAGEIRGLAARSAQPETGGGQITVNSLKWSRTAIDVELTSSIDQTISLHLPPSAQAPLVRPITLTAHKPAALHFTLK